MEMEGWVWWGQPAQDIIDHQLQVTVVSRSIHDEITAMSATHHPGTCRGQVEIV